MPDDNGTGGQEPQLPPEPTDLWADPESARSEIEKLRQESARWRTKVRDLEPLAKKAQEQDEAAKTELQKALDRAVQAERAAQVAQLEATRMRVATAHGLTEVQAKRLVGATPDELEADAKEFAKEIGAARRPPDLKQGDRGAPAPPDPDAWLRRMVNNR
jgi:chromosome segregation ATPase